MAQGYNQLNLFETQPYINKPSNMINAAKATRGAVKTGISLTPYVGDVWDIGRGLYQATHGHPFVGTGQALLGAGGLAANVFFPGEGTLAKIGVKKGIKEGAKALGYLSPKIARGVKNYAAFNRSALGQGLTAGVPEVYYGISDYLSNNVSDSTNKDDNKNSNNNNSSSTNKTNDGSYNQSSAMPQQAGMILGVRAQQPIDTTSEQQPNIDAINNYVQQLKDINQPYLEALQGYIDNYNNLFNQQQMYGRRLRDISAITGNPIWYQSARDYNPVIQEANRLNAIKQLQQSQATDVNAINEMMGNLAAVQQMGLTPETAFANKNLLTMMAAKDREDNRLQIALENNLMKKYGIDRNYARALTVQAMRNQGAMDRAILNAQTYGYGGYQPAPGLTQQGQARPPIAINQVQQGGMAGDFKNIVGR